MIDRMDTMRDCCMCGLPTLVSITELVQNEEISRQINEEYDIPGGMELHGDHIGVLCELCRSAADKFLKDQDA